jgi:Zn-dependent protease with chaperone function
MNFFEHQEHARSMTRNMIWMLIAAVLALIALTNITLTLIFAPEAIFDSSSWIGVAAVLLTIIALASAYRIASLREGGKAIAQAMGGTQINHHRTDPHYRRLLNVVEEIAIASGVPCPDVFVLEDEDGINAFAAGYSSTDAAIGVTRGTLMKLSRDELQGVIAHEFSHILNGDMRLNIRLVGLLFGISVMGIIGRKILEGTSRSSSDSKGLVVAGLAIWALGAAGLLCARLIKAKVSRSREFLADASAVQFTRSASGIAGALKKIGGLSAGSQLQNHQAEEYRHMLFGSSMGNASLFDTHPDLGDRISRLDKSFVASQLDRIARAEDANADSFLNGEPASAAAILGLVQGDQKTRQPNSPANEPTIVATEARQALIEQVAHPQTSHFEKAKAIRKGFAPELKRAAHQREEVCVLVIALALAKANNTRSAQLILLEQNYGSAFSAEVQNLLPQVLALSPEQRLPLVSLCFPTLKLRPEADIKRLFAMISLLAQADQQLDVFEYSLLRLLAHSTFEAKSADVRLGNKRLRDCANAVQTVLSVLAHFGHTEDAPGESALNAQRAFEQAVKEFDVGISLHYQMPNPWPETLDQALTELNQLQIHAKQALLRALIACTFFDATVSASESELLRVVCARLHCPMPPILSLVSAESVADL